MTHRVARSELSIPAVNWRMIEKGLASAADLVFLDLEDSVSPDNKAEARNVAIRALRELDWGTKPPAYRVNSLDTPFFYRDLVDVVEQVGDVLARIVVPKVNRHEDVIVVDTLLTGIERALGLECGRIALEAQIETAQGVREVEHIARASGRLEALDFGPGDYAASMGMPATSIGTLDAWDKTYPGHRMHYPMSRIMVAARSAGIQAIDGPVADYRDLEGFRKSCKTARSLGYDGKWCIHPAQIPVANEEFLPTHDEIIWAREVVEAYSQATDAGRGAIPLGTIMIDAASIRMAQATLHLAQAAGLEDGNR